MAVDQQNTPKTPFKTHLSTAPQSHLTRRRLIFLRRRNKLPTVRLGGKKPRRGLFIVKVLKKIRLKWLKLQYTCMLRNLRNYYRNLIKDIIEAGATVEAMQQRMFMESTFAVPVMGVSFASFPSASDRGRTRPVLFF
ncbi:hypothetical protein CCACVL1_18729 [Corchorus capsularis]|uniref:Uncharacterized protein n=1 Tax=Corchorus capsularis TaxID=210143 RepID=A0A1R3HK59_COCAP|nr:hypothetical protein CCACVL1_18729 [Corchorus capsularis]